MNAKPLAILIAVLMVTITVAPAITDGSDAAADDTDVTVEEDYEFGILAAFAIGLVVGAIIGAVSVSVASPSDAPAGNNDEVNGKFRAMEADKVATAMDTAKNLVSSVLPADTDLWAFTTNYWGRSAELAVAEYWNTDDDFEEVVNDVLNLTGMPGNISNYLYSWSEAIDEGYNNLSSQSAKWDSIYSGMTLSLKWNGGSISSVTNSDAGKIVFDMLQTVTPVSGSDVVYIDTDYSNADVDYTYYDRMYVFGQSSEYTIVNVDTNVTYTLAKGSNDLNSVSGNQSTGRLPSGFYRLSAGATYAGPVSMSGGNDAADIGGGLVVRNGTDTYLIRPTATGISISNSIGVVTSRSDTLAFEISYTDSNGNGATRTSSLVGDGYNIVRDYDSLVGEISHVMDQSVEYAEALWKIFDACESSNEYLSPSSIVTGIPGYSVSSAEAEGIYIQAMMQIASFYEDNRKIIDGIEIVTNTESLDLYCYGDIYFNGQLWAENVIFTPYVTSKDISLSVGENTWQGSGMCMVWAQVDDPSDWNGDVSLTDYALMDLSDGYVLDIENIQSKGSPVNSVSLTKTAIQKYNTGSDEVIDPESEAKMLSATTLIAIIFLELAVILALLGFYNGMQWLVIVGAIVAIVALLWPQVIASICLGTFEWSDLVPGGWFL